MDLSTLCDTKRCMQANACLLCALLFEAKTTCFTGGGDFGSDLYMASLMGGTVRGSAMPAGNHVRMRRAGQFGRAHQNTASFHIQYSPTAEIMQLHIIMGS